MAVGRLWLFRNSSKLQLFCTYAQNWPNTKNNWNVDSISSKLIATVKPETFFFVPNVFKKNNINAEHFSRGNYINFIIVLKLKCIAYHTLSLSLKFLLEYHHSTQLYASYALDRDWEARTVILSDAFVGVSHLSYTSGNHPVLIESMLVICQ